MLCCADEQTDNECVAESNMVVSCKYKREACVVLVGGMMSNNKAMGVMMEVLLKAILVCLRSFKHHLNLTHD